MKSKFQQKNMRFLLGDVRDIDRLKLALKEIDVVFHANIKTSSCCRI